MTDLQALCAKHNVTLGAHDQTYYPSFTLYVGDTPVYGLAVTADSARFWLDPDELGDYAPNFPDAREDFDLHFPKERTSE